MRAIPQSYPGDLSDEQWELLAPLIPPSKPGGRPRRVDVRAVINALFYVLCMGCAWRWLPHDYPAWQTVYHYAPHVAQGRHVGAHPRQALSMGASQ